MIEHLPINEQKRLSRALRRSVAMTTEADKVAELVEQALDLRDMLMRGERRMTPDGAAVKALIPVNRLSTLDELASELTRLSAEVDRLRADSARLDYLDSLNRALNDHYGTRYGWELIVNHNVTRLHFKHMSVDLNDAAAHGFDSCRDVIDRKMAEFAAHRRAEAQLAALQQKEG